MSFNVLATSRFEKEFKKLFKKYKSLKIEVLDLISSLEDTQFRELS